MLIGAPFQAAQMTATAALQAQGRPRSSFAVMLIGTLVNAGLAPLFIFGLKWGVGGAGLAVAISQALSLVVTMAFVLDRKSLVKLRARYLMPVGGERASRVLAEVAKIGLPSSLSSSWAARPWWSPITRSSLTGAS